MEMQDDMIGQAANQMEFDQEEQADADKQRKRGSTFLKMFRFDKARTPKNAQEENQSQGLLDQSIDYANYLIEI